MGLRGEAAIVGLAEYPHQRKYDGPRRFMLEQWAELTALALADAGLEARDINGLVCSDIRESGMFAPATVAEYLGRPVNSGRLRAWRRRSRWRSRCRCRPR